MGWDDPKWKKYQTQGSDPLNTLLNDLSERVGLDPFYTGLLRQRETGGLTDPHGAVSSAGALGAMQVMPQTGQEMATKYGLDFSTPEGKTEAGVRYYKDQLDRFEDPATAAAAYHSGPGKVQGILDAGGDLGTDLGPVGRDYYKWFNERVQGREAEQAAKPPEPTAPQPGPGDTTPTLAPPPPEAEMPMWQKAMLGFAEGVESTQHLPGLAQFHAITGAQKQAMEKHVYGPAVGYDPEAGEGTSLGQEAILKPAIETAVPLINKMPGPDWMKEAARAGAGVAAGAGAALLDIATDPLVWELSYAKVPAGALARVSPRLAQGFVIGMKGMHKGFQLSMAQHALTDIPRGIVGVAQDEDTTSAWSKIGGGTVSGYFVAHPFMKAKRQKGPVKISMWDEQAGDFAPLAPQTANQFMRGEGIRTVADALDTNVRALWDLAKEKGIKVTDAEGNEQTIYPPNVDIPGQHLVFGSGARARAVPSEKGGRLGVDVGYLMADAMRIKDEGQRAQFLADAIHEISLHEIGHLLDESGVGHELPLEFRREAAALAGEVGFGPESVLAGPRALPRLSWEDFQAKKKALTEKWGLPEEGGLDAYGERYNGLRNLIGNGDIAAIIAKLTKHQDPQGFIERYSRDPKSASKEITMERWHPLFGQLMNELGALDGVMPGKYLEAIRTGEMGPATGPELMARQGGTPLPGAKKRGLARPPERGMEAAGEERARLEKEGLWEDLAGARPAGTGEARRAQGLQPPRAVVPGPEVKAGAGEGIPGFEGKPTLPEPSGFALKPEVQRPPKVGGPRSMEDLLARGKRRPQELKAEGEREDLPREVEADLKRWFTKEHRARRDSDDILDADPNMRIPRSEVSDYLRTKHGVEVGLTEQGKVQRVIGPLLQKLVREETKARKPEDPLKAEGEREPIWQRRRREGVERRERGETKPRVMTQYERDLVQEVIPRLEKLRDTARDRNPQEARVAEYRLKEARKELASIRRGESKAFYAEGEEDISKFGPRGPKSPRYWGTRERVGRRAPSVGQVSEDMRPRLRTPEGLKKPPKEKLGEPRLPETFFEEEILKALGARRVAVDRDQLRADIAASSRTPFELEKMIARYAGEAAPEAPAYKPGRARMRAPTGARPRFDAIEATRAAIEAKKARGEDTSDLEAWVQRQSMEAAGEKEGPIKPHPKAAMFKKARERAKAVTEKLKEELADVEKRIAATDRRVDQRIFGGPEKRVEKRRKVEAPSAVETPAELMARAERQLKERLKKKEVRDAMKDLKKFQERKTAALQRENKLIRQLLEGPEPGKTVVLNTRTPEQSTELLGNKRPVNKKGEVQTAPADVETREDTQKPWGPSKYHIGMKVEHPEFGPGTVETVRSSGAVRVRFDLEGLKTMMAESIRPRKNADIVAQVKKDMKAAGEFEDEKFREFSTGGSSTLKQMFVQRVYGDSPPGETWAKEITQNILDSFDMRRNDTNDPKFRGKGKIAFDESKGELTAEDNGIGMSPEFMEKHFLNPGDSGKRGGDADYRGNFGIAKLAIFGFGDPFQASSVFERPNGTKVRTVVRGVGMDWIGESKAQISEPVEVSPNTPTGLKIKVILDKDIAGFSNVKPGQLLKYLKRTLSSEMLDDRIDVVVNGEKVDIQKGKVWHPSYGEEGLRGEGSWQESPYVNKKTIDDLEARYEISYADPPAHGTSTIGVELYNRGQFQSGTYDNNMTVHLESHVKGVPASIRVNVKSKVIGTHKDYPWEFDRKNLKGNGHTVIREWISSMQRKAENDTRLRYQRAESTSPKLAGTGIRFVMPEFDMTDPKVKDLAERIAADPAYVELGKALRRAAKLYTEKVARPGEESSSITQAVTNLGWSGEWNGLWAPHSWYPNGRTRIMINPWLIMESKVIPELPPDPTAPRGSAGIFGVEAKDLPSIISRNLPGGWAGEPTLERTHRLADPIRFNLQNALRMKRAEGAVGRAEYFKKLKEEGLESLAEIDADEAILATLSAKWDKQILDLHDNWWRPEVLEKTTAEFDRDSPYYGKTTKDRITEVASAIAGKWVKEGELKRLLGDKKFDFIDYHPYASFVADVLARAHLERAGDAALGRAQTVANHAETAAAHMVSTAMHEVSHNWEANHDVGFAGEMTRNMALGLVVGSKAYKPVERWLADPKNVARLREDYKELMGLSATEEMISGAVAEKSAKPSFKAEGEFEASAEEARKGFPTPDRSLIRTIKNANPEELRKMAIEFRPEIIRSLRRALRKETKDTDFEGVGLEDLRTRRDELTPEARALVDRISDMGGMPEEIDRIEGISKYDPLFEKLGAPRAVITSLDLSGIMRQGIIGTARLALAFPVKFRGGFSVLKGQRTLVSAINNSIRALAKEKSFRKAMDAVESSTDYNTLKALGVDFAKQEEQFGGAKYVEGVFKKLTGGRGNFVRMSERAYTYYLNRLRYELGKQHLDKMRQLGFKLNTVVDPKGRTRVTGDTAAYKKMADWINIASGRGSLPRGQDKLSAAVRSADKFLNMVFFSPRLILARIATLNPATYMSALGEMRKAQGSYKAVRALSAMHIGDLVAYSGLVAGVMGGLKMLFPEADFEDDLTSSDFGQIRMGNTRADVTGGLRTYLTAAARLATGETKTEYGVVKPQARGATIANFLRGKLGPVPSLALTMAEGQNVVGEPAYGPLKDVITGDQPITPEVLDEILKTTGGTIAEQTVLPMILSDAWKLMVQNEFTPEQITALLSLATLGVGVSTRISQPGITPTTQAAFRRANVEPLSRPSTVSSPFRDALGRQMELKLPYMIRKHVQEYSDKSYYEILHSVVSQESFQRMPPAAQRIVVLTLLTDARQARSPRALREWGRERLIPKVKEEFYPEELSRLRPPPRGFPRKKRWTELFD